MNKRVQAPQLTSWKSGWFAAILMLVLGIIGFSLAIITNRQIDQMSRWISCQGRIREVREYGYRIDSKRGSQFVYGLNISYGYYVHHKLYQDRMINPYYLETKDFHQFLSWKSRYAPGSGITVYYDPKNPTDSELFIDNSKPVILIAGIFWSVVGLAIVIILLLSKNRKREEQGGMV